jgi:hypothetical protein
MKGSESMAMHTNREGFNPTENAGELLTQSLKRFLWEGFSFGQATVVFTITI